VFACASSQNPPVIPNHEHQVAYFPCLIVWLAVGVSTTERPQESRAAESQTFNREIREWTDATGTHHARASLLRFKGDKVWFKTADGRLTSTTLSRLSLDDQKYVAAHVPRQDPGTNHTAKETVVTALDRLPSLKQAADSLKMNNSDTPRRVVPAALVYVRLSRAFLEDYVDRTVHDRKPVSDCILGTRIVGDSDTTGKIHLLLRPTFGKLSGEIAFDGTVHSRTTGYNGPVIIHSVSDAMFRARKPISLDTSGLNVASATASAPTNLQTVGIESTLPRLRGRIATRIASRRNAALHMEAQDITSQHTAANIRHDFDKRIDQSVARIRQVFRLNVPGLDVDRDRGISVMRFRSTANYVEMAMVRQGASAEESSLRPPPVDGEPDLAIRVNRALFGATIGDSQLSQQFAPLLVKALEARIKAKAVASGKTAVASTDDGTKWSMDQLWLAMDFTDPARQVSAPAFK
jgi:uncharacterized protein (DUF2267 family)